MIPLASPIKPVAAWAGTDQIRGRTLRSVTMILLAGGCRWGRCRMCGYHHVRDSAVDEAARLKSLQSQLAWVSDNLPLDKADLIKVYTSGSVLDHCEVPTAFLEDLCRIAAGKTLLFETRPEFVEEEVIGRCIDSLKGEQEDPVLYVAIGLETTSDAVRDYSIRKGFSWADFRDAASRARRAGAGVKAYLLHKPLFLTERQALDDMHRSIQEVLPYADLISLNPATVQKGTDMERFWRQGAYRPAYLWSVLSVLLGAQVNVTCDPVGGGHARGPHNCGTCDRDILPAIRDFSLTGDRALLDALVKRGCACQREWEFVLDEERSFRMPLTR